MRDSNNQDDNTSRNILVSVLPALPALAGGAIVSAVATTVIQEPRTKFVLATIGCGSTMTGAFTAVGNMVASCYLAGAESVSTGAKVAAAALPPLPPVFIGCVMFLVGSVVTPNETLNNVAFGVLTGGLVSLACNTVASACAARNEEPRQEGGYAGQVRQQQAAERSFLINNGR